MARLTAPLSPDAGPFFLMKPRYQNDGGSFLILRDEHLLITGGNVVAAALIHIFEHWHYHKLANNKQNLEANDVAQGHHAPRTFTETIYQWHTNESLEQQLKGLGKKDSILKARRLLVDLAIISEHQNPNPGFKYDKTVHFIFYPDQVAQYVQQFDKNRGTSSENRQGPSGNIDSPTSENRRHQYISSINNETLNTSTAPGATVPKPEPPKKETGGKKKTGAADPGWQKWVDRWDEFYKGRNDGMAPMFNGAQLGPSGLKGIRKHLTAVAKQEDGKSPDDCGFLAWDYMLNHWDDMGDQFLQTQFDLTVILKKINDILNRLKNGTTTNRGAYSNGAQSNAQQTGTSQQRNAALRDY
jgi:hypothetical protein